MKHALSIMLVFTILCSCVFSCAIAETRASNYFSSYGTSMTAVGNGRIAITFKAVGTGICNQIGVANYQVQKLNDDGDWVFVSNPLSGQTVQRCGDGHGQNHARNASRASADHHGSQHPDARQSQRVTDGVRIDEVALNLLQHQLKNQKYKGLDGRKGKDHHRYPSAYLC